MHHSVCNQQICENLFYYLPLSVPWLTDLCKSVVIFKYQRTHSYVFTCGQRFKHESELNTHLKAHKSKPIKCDHCDYMNKEQRNVQAHMRVHSNQLPFVCILCGKHFRWQEQKWRHIPNCPGDWLYWKLLVIMLECCIFSSFYPHCDCSTPRYDEQAWMFMYSYI